MKISEFKSLKKYETILFLGVSLIQYNTILSAKKVGYKIIGVDKNSNTKSKILCDHFINQDCKNINKILKQLKKLKNYKIINIWANNDVILISKYKLEKKLKIKSDIKFTKINNFLNKEKFKKIFKKYQFNF